MKIKNSKKIIIVIVALLLAFAAYFIWKNTQQKKADNPQVQTAKIEEQKNKVLEKVKMLVAIPDETPIFFTVSNAELLKSQQEFFKDSQNGDVLLVFEKNKILILYRDNPTQIVNMGPLTNSTSTNPTSTTTTKTIKNK